MRRGVAPADYMIGPRKVTDLQDRTYLSGAVSAGTSRLEVTEKLVRLRQSDTLSLQAKTRRDHSTRSSLRAAWTRTGGR